MKNPALKREVSRIKNQYKIKMLLKKNQQRVAQHYLENYKLTELNLIKDMISCH